MPSALYEFEPIDIIDQDQSEVPNNLVTDNSGQIVAALMSNDQAVYVSQDYGFNWNMAPLPTLDQYGDPNYWYGVAISGNGENIYVFSGAATVYSCLHGSDPYKSISWLESTAFSVVYSLQTNGNGSVVAVLGTTAGDYMNEYNTIVSFDYGLTISLITPFTDGFCSAFVIDDIGSTMVCSILDSESTGLIYVSQDFGVTWVSYVAVSDNPSTYPYYGDLLSASIYNLNDIIYLSSADESSVYISTTQGKSWIDSTIKPSVSAYAIACTGNGDTVYFATDTGLYQSSDIGNSWQLIFDQTVFYVAVSGDGDNIYLSTGMGLYVYHRDSSLTGAPNPSPTMAPTPVKWNELLLPSSECGYQQVIISECGDYALAAQCGYVANLVLVNITSGESAVSSSVQTSWTGLCMSADGSRMVAVGGGKVYYLVDYDVNLLKPASIVSIDTSMEYVAYSCAMTGSGNVTVIAQQTFQDDWLIAIYVTNNKTFIPRFAPVPTSPVTYSINSYSNVAIDSTGEVIAIMSNDPGTLYLTTDGGLTWASPRSSQASYANLFAMSQHQQGQFMMISAYDYVSLEVSINQGTTWYDDTVAGHITSSNSLSNSYSGQQAIISTDQGIFISGDYGVTWDFSLLLGEASSAYASVDPSGKYFVAVSDNSNVLRWLYYVVTPHPTQLPTLSPTHVPSYSIAPTHPTQSPTVKPTRLSTTCSPTAIPTDSPVFPPAAFPPSFRPTSVFSDPPSNAPFSSPSLVPTTQPTSVTGFPTTTASPTPTPLTSGWLYGRFYLSTSCTGDAVLVNGDRLNSCLPMNSSSWYSLACDGTTVVTTTYNDPSCVATSAISTETYSVPTTLIDYVDSTCSFIDCTASTSLQVSSDAVYSMDQYFDDDGGTADTCYNSLHYEGYLNNVCLPLGMEGAATALAVFPWIATYSSSDCSGTPTSNTTFPTGCIDGISAFPTSSISLIPTQSISKQIFQRLFDTIPKPQTRRAQSFSSGQDDDTPDSQFVGHSFTKVEIVDSSSSSSSSSSVVLSSGAVAGIVIAGIIGMGLIIGVALWYWTGNHSWTGETRSTNIELRESTSNPLSNPIL